jgi:beta-mannosidase
VTLLRSGAWDWAPYGVTFTAAKDHTFSKGLIKSVYLLHSPSIFLLHSAITSIYTGPYMPEPPPRDNTIGPFTVKARLFIRNVQSTPTSSVLKLKGNWCPAASAHQDCSVQTSVTLPPGESNQEIQFENIAAAPWWPNAIGLPPQDVARLYSATVSVAGDSTPSISVTVSIGFRAAHLVTGDDSSSHQRHQLLQQDGSSNFTMRLKVNGANVWARGGNMIPMEELEGRQSVEAYRALVASAAAAHFNMLRVWGGGVFLPEEFYSACDEAGIMVFHDMMCARCLLRQS